MENDERLMTVSEAIAHRLTDGLGDFNVGKENGFTVINIVNDMGLPVTDDNRKNVQIEILGILKKYRDDYGVLAGGIGRNPTTYIVAGNELEEREIARKYIALSKAYSNGLLTISRCADSELITNMAKAIEGMVGGLSALLYMLPESTEK